MGNGDLDIDVHMHIRGVNMIDGDMRVTGRVRPVRRLKQGIKS